VVASGAVIPYPPGTADFQHEVELVVALGRGGFEVDEAAAGDMVFGYACGLDMTRRDLQQRARQAGLPWDVAKDFEHAAVLSEIVPKADCGSIERGAIRLSVNGALRQSSDVSLLIWSVPEIIAHLSRLYQLQPGDVIYTGTPEGVGPVLPGDRLQGSVAGVGEIALTIAAG
jgi:fumarylpyruvate hydrolase